MKSEVKGTATSKRLGNTAILYPIFICSEHIPEDSDAHMTDERTSKMINND